MFNLAFIERNRPVGVISANRSGDIKSIRELDIDSNVRISI